MLRIALAVFIVGAMNAWGQAQSGEPAAADKVDHATAYYHFMVSRMYAEMAANSRSNNRDYAAKAIENYKAALKADPNAPDPTRLRAGFPILFRPGPPPPRQDHSLP